MFNGGTWRRREYTHSPSPTLAHRTSQPAHPHHFPSSFPFHSQSTALAHAPAASFKLPHNQHIAGHALVLAVHRRFVSRLCEGALSTCVSYSPPIAPLSEAVDGRKTKPPEALAHPPTPISMLAAPRRRCPPVWTK